MKLSLFSFLEWTNSYLFSLDLMAIFTLGAYVVARWRKEWGFLHMNLAVGLTTYLVGQTGSRFLSFSLRYQLNRGIDITWMDAAWMIVVLAATTAIISIGLMCICRAFAKAYWGRNVWPWLIAGAAGISTALIYLT